MVYYVGPICSHDPNRLTFHVHLLRPMEERRSDLRNHFFTNGGRAKQKSPARHRCPPWNEFVLFFAAQGSTFRHMQRFQTGWLPVGLFDGVPWSFGVVFLLVAPPQNGGRCSSALYGNQYTPIISQPKCAESFLLSFYPSQ